MSEEAKIAKGKEAVALFDKSEKLFSDLNEPSTKYGFKPEEFLPKAYDYLVEAEKLSSIIDSIRNVEGLESANEKEQVFNRHLRLAKEWFVKAYYILLVHQNNYVKHWTPVIKEYSDTFKKYSDTVGKKPKFDKIKILAIVLGIFVAIMYLNSIFNACSGHSSDPYGDYYKTVEEYNNNYRK